MGELIDLWKPNEKLVSCEHCGCTSWKIMALLDQSLDAIEGFVIQCGNRECENKEQNVFNPGDGGCNYG